MLEKRSSQSVLIVNEDPDVLILLSSMLQRNGFRVLSARNSREAVEITARHYIPVDLILCDVLVDGESGDLLARELQKLRPSMRELYLSTATDEGAIRIRVVKQTDGGGFTPSGDLNFIDQVRNSLSPPMHMSA
jgi:response regulator RpfG family c-di-GMP phosphodiesterase